MPGLLEALLPAIYSQGDRAKRYLKGAIHDPLGTAQQYIGNLNDQAGLGLGLLSASGSPVATPSPQEQAARNALIDKLGPAMMGATVWHGSPHVFDKFDASKIGTGEGAQAYGHGLYLADSPEVAGQYANKLSDLNQLTPQGRAAQALQQAKGDVLGARRLLYEQFNDAQSGPMQDAAMMAVDALNKGGVKAPNLYKVDLPDSAIANMLDWDKPLAQQPAAQNVFKDMHESAGGQGYAHSDGYAALGLGSTDQLRGADLYRMLRENYAPGADVPGAPAWLQQQAGAAADRLKQAGIPGIRYLDGGSRGAGAGTSNYVVFPGQENMLQILLRNGQPIDSR